jgi:hypothetical protein
VTTPPVGLLLGACGLILLAVGTWRSYVVARQALGPLAHQGDPTRAAVEAGRPLAQRATVRTVASRAVIAMGWLAIAMYGLYLAVRGQVFLG